MTDRKVLTTDTLGIFYLIPSSLFTKMPALQELILNIQLCCNIGTWIYVTLLFIRNKHIRAASSLPFIHAWSI